MTHVIAIPLPTSEADQSGALTTGQPVRIVQVSSTLRAVVTGQAEDGEYLLQREMLGVVIEEKFPRSMLRTDAEYDALLARAEAADSDPWIDDGAPWVDPIRAAYDRDWREHQWAFDTEHQGRW